MLDVAIEEQGGSLVVTPRMMRLDAVVATGFRDIVAPMLNGHPNVVIDLGMVQFVDSSGLATFVSLLKRMPAGGQLRLCQVHENVKQLLRLTRLDKIFRMYDTLSMATQ